METAGTIIKDALFEILQQGDEAPIEASEAQTAIRYLNRMMLRWDAVGYPLGFTVISSLGDLVTIPDGAVDGVVTNLAVSLAPQYDVQLSPALIANAQLGLEAIRVLSVVVGPSALPSTLPIGSGNEGGCTSTDNHFYPDQQSDILAETTGSIVLEEDTP